MAKVQRHQYTMTPISTPKDTIGGPRESSDVENLQVAQILADLNQLQNATDQKAALSLLQIKDTLDRRQLLSKKTLPTPENVYGSLRKRESYGSGQNPQSTPSISPSPAARARAESNLSNSGIQSLTLRRPVATREDSAASSTSSRRSSATVRENGNSTHIPATEEDPDLLRAHTLLALHSTRSTLLKACPTYVSSPSESSPLETARQNVRSILAKYTMLKQEEIARDPQGMKAALEGVGLSGFE